MDFWRGIGWFLLIIGLIIILHLVGKPPTPRR